MSDHDALCAYTLPEQDRDPHDHCTCDRLALARADERERIAQAIEEKADDYGWDPVADALYREEGTSTLDNVRDLVKDEIHDCAAIARGDEQ